MIHKYKVETDENGYIVSFCVPVNQAEAMYEFDGSLLELDFINAYKIVNDQPWLDEEKKAEIIAEREAEAEKPTQLDVVEAQVTYTALMTDTLLGE